MHRVRRPAGVEDRPTIGVDHLGRRDRWLTDEANDRFQPRRDRRGVDIVEIGDQRTRSVAMGLKDLQERDDHRIVHDALRLVDKAPCVLTAKGTR